jgi:hypothetical protein
MIEGLLNYEKGPFLGSDRQEIETMVRKIKRN